MRLLPAVLVGVLLAGSGCAAVRNNQKARKVHALNDEALVDLKAGNARQAQKKLNEALQEVQKNELGAHSSAAQTHMNLGVVLASGLNQRHRAVSEMMAALAISPRIEPPSDFRDAKVQRAFALAKARQSAAESAPAAAKPAPPPPPPPPVAEPAPAVAEAPAAPAGKGKRAKNRRGKADKASPAPTQPAPAPTQPAPAVAETASPPVAASPPSAEEAAVPSPLPEPITCPLPDRVPPGQPVPVWCGIEADLRAKSATLFVRPREAPDFVALPMTRSARGWWGATINGDIVAAGLLQFYVQAEGGGGTRVASSGDAYSPNILLVQAGARRAPAVITQAVLDGDDEGGDEPVAVEEPLEEKGGFDWSRVFVSLQVGTGWGWHQESALEFRQDITVPSGTASAGLFHVLPEVGYRLSDRWAVSLQTRHQFLPNEGDTGGRPGRPARAANAALLRLLHTRSITERFSIIGSVALGGGEGFRMALGPVPNRGRSGSDSVRGGPLLVGAGGGVGFDVTPRFAVVAELRALVGLPDLAAIGEFNLGLRYAFGTLTP